MTSMTSIFRSAAEAAQFLHEAGLPKSDAVNFVEEIALLTAETRDRALEACAARIAKLIKEQKRLQRVIMENTGLFTAEQVRQCLSDVSARDQGLKL